VSVSARLKYTLVWLAISLVIGAIAHFGFGQNFIASAVIAGVALTLNGLLAEWEDRQPGGFNAD
jgi:hypothetical protein